MTSEFNPIGRPCVVLTENESGNFGETEFEGESVGFLEEFLGIQGSHTKDDSIITIEWFPRAWILSGRIKFQYSVESTETQNKQNLKNTITDKSPSFSEKEPQIPVTSSDFSRAIPNLPKPTFASIVRYVIKSGRTEEMFKEIAKSPSKEAVSQHTMITGDQEIVNVTLVPDLDGMVSKEETGVNWLDTVEHMLVKFPNGSRTEACSGSILYFSMNNENSIKAINETLSMSAVRFRIKDGCQTELTELLTDPQLHHQEILSCVVQIEERDFIWLNKVITQEKRANGENSSTFLNTIGHCIDYSEDNNVTIRSGIVTDFYNTKAYG